MSLVAIEMDGHCVSPSLNKLQAKQQEQQREMENAERAKSTAKFTKKMKEKCVTLNGS